MPKGQEFQQVDDMGSNLLSCPPGRLCIFPLDCVVQTTVDAQWYQAAVPSPSQRQVSRCFSFWVPRSLTWTMLSVLPVSDLVIKMPEV